MAWKTLYEELIKKQNGAADSSGSQGSSAGSTGESRTGIGGVVSDVATQGAAIADLLKGTGGSTGTGRTTTYTVNAGNQKYVDQMNALYGQIMGRGAFQYDLASDPLYKQMADQYTQLGQQASRDVMGQAAALTGGYGNSYATQVGNQAYQQYLTALNESIPDFYDRAYQQYQNEGDRLLQMYELAAAHPGYLDAISPKTYTVTQESEDEEDSGSTDAYLKLLQSMLGTGTSTESTTPTFDFTDYLKLFM